MKKCGKNFKNEIKKEKKEFLKILNELENQNKDINHILQKINKELSLYKYKSESFICNKRLAEYGKEFLNTMKELYKKCLC